MASLRAQIFAAVAAKLETVRQTLDWTSLLVNPRDDVGEDQLNAVLLAHGGDREPSALTGHVEMAWLEFSAGMMVMESAAASAEELLDAGFVAICDALLDRMDIQLSGLAVGIERGAVSDPVFGRGPKGARILGGQSIDFIVQYLVREGDASCVGP